MHRFTGATVIIASLVFAPTGYSQDGSSTPSTASTSQESEIQATAPVPPFIAPHIPGVLKVCGPKGPPPCAQVPPHLVNPVDPEYSREARKNKITGIVGLWLVVGPDGRPHEVLLVRSLGYGLDEEAIKAVKKWKFSPATRDGQPVAVQINANVDFHLY
jgi:TonB family protein